MRRGLRSAASTDRATIPDVDPPRPQPRRNTTTSILSPSHGTCSGVSPARSYRQAVEKGGAPATAAPSASPMMHLPGGASAAAGAALQEDTRGGQVLQAATMSKSEKLGLHVLASSPDVTDARSSLVPGRGEGEPRKSPTRPKSPAMPAGMPATVAASNAGTASGALPMRRAARQLLIDKFLAEVPVKGSGGTRRADAKDGARGSAEADGGTTTEPDAAAYAMGPDDAATGGARDAYDDAA